MLTPTITLTVRSGRYLAAWLEDHSADADEIRFHPFPSIRRATGYSSDHTVLMLS